jgi:hypothetical protein
MDSEEEDEEENQESPKKPGSLFYRSIPSQFQPSSQRILSRDRILDMVSQPSPLPCCLVILIDLLLQCTRGDESNLSLDQDEVANSSEAYEENDVLFFDNNIDRTIPAIGAEQTMTNFALATVERPLPQTTQTKPKARSPTKKPKSLPQVDVPVDRDDLPVSNSPSLNSPAPLSAVHLSDDTLVTMLSQPPKSIPQMRTKSSFQDFFRGITEERMKQLLHRAYGSMNDLEREVKVRKRMELLAGVLSD